ncbi:MAG: winged helix-turn-helix transcriptional regulator [Candidatus Riflebacteria bacterium]|nr:winged helix-turn-helix transcriptional regulator [Candidatus Riflebacteria bacterium]
MRTQLIRGRLYAVSTDPRPGGPADARTLRRAFHSLIRRFGLLDAERTPCGQPVPVSHAHALIELLARPGVRQADLGDSLGLSKSAVSRMVDQLERRRWLERRADAGDGRVRRLMLTAKGRQVALRINEASLGRFSVILEAVPAVARAGVIASLELLRDAIPRGQQTRGDRRTRR